MGLTVKKFSFPVAVVLLQVLLPGAEGQRQGCGEKVADVVFLLDSSHSIWPHQFQAQLLFLQQLVESFSIGPSNMRVGVATFSNSVMLEFTLDDHLDKLELLQAISNIQQHTGGTATDLAIHFAHTEIFTARSDNSTKTQQKQISQLFPVCIKILTLPEIPLEFLSVPSPDKGGGLGVELATPSRKRLYATETPKGDQQDYSALGREGSSTRRVRTPCGERQDSGSYKADILSFDQGYQHNHPENTRQQASLARRKGIQVFAIGVGLEDSELPDIVSQPVASHLFRVQRYENLPLLHDDLVGQVCLKKNRTNPDADSWTESMLKDIAIKRCKKRQADIYFLLDSSSSISQSQFEEELRFIPHLLHLMDLGPQHTRIGLAVFSDGVHNVISLTDSQTVHSIKTTLQSLPYTTGGTDIGRALHFVRTTGFAVGRKQASRLIILLTDGQSTNATATLQEAQNAQQQGIQLFVVGIGSQTDVQELMQISSDPNENFMFSVDDFGGLKNVRDLLAVKVCDVPNISDSLGDEALSSDDHCVSGPTDVIFAYDSAAVNREEDDVISGAISNLVNDVGQDTVRFGLIRENCLKGDNIDLLTGATGETLQVLLQKTHHQGLQALLKRARLHGYLADYDVSRRGVHKVMVLFLDNKQDEIAAVLTEVKRLRFQGLRLLVISIDNKVIDIMLQATGVHYIHLQAYDKLPEARETIRDNFCEILQH